MNNELSNEIVENRTIYPIMETEVKSMIITATEFKKNLGKYLELVENEDITITKNGKPIAVLAKPIDKLAILKSLYGAAKPVEEDFDIERIKMEKYSKK